jgi:putative DNA primase/helicase
MFHEKTTHAAKGKWRGILMHLGIPADALRNVHGPCPLCGGTDRFRFDNRDGLGTYICGQCGAGDGMKLACEFTGKPFPDVAAQIDRVLGNVKTDAAPRPPMTEEQRRQALRAVWAETQPVKPGDLAHTYLAARHIDEVIYPKALRFAPAIRDGEGGIRPALVALVGLWGEKPCTIHRTFLRPDGKAKAEMPAPRKLMPGDLPDGACVQLSDWTQSGTLGIAEGIETALSASAMFGLPVWAAINSAMLAKWCPPAGCEGVSIFADNDPKFGGQAAAYRLAHRLAVKGLPVTIHVPPAVGTDWADVWAERKRAAQ